MRANRPTRSQTDVSGGVRRARTTRTAVRAPTAMTAPAATFGSCCLTRSFRLVISRVMSRRTSATAETSSSRSRWISVTTCACVRSLTRSYPLYRVLRAPRFLDRLLGHRRRALLEDAVGDQADHGGQQA